MLTDFWNKLRDAILAKCAATAPSAPRATPTPAAPTRPPNPAPPTTAPKGSVPATPFRSASSATPGSGTVPTVPSPAGPTIAVVNQSTVLGDAQVRAGVAAVQVQIDRDFMPAWFTRAALAFVPRGQTPPADAWVVAIMDTSDQAGALGYHDLTDAGLPVGRVFAKDDKDNGLSWSVTLSHEVLEMMGDPYVASTVFVQDSATTGTLVALEMADAVEDDSFGYLVNGVLVSNFVLPAFFEAGRAPGSTKFDFRGVLRAPLTIAKGGYLSVFRVDPKTAGWTQQFSEHGMGRRFKSKGAASRPKRRAAKGRQARR